MNALPSQEPFVIPGPVGPLEGRLELPEQAPGFAGVFGHPHPQHGGTMQNNVVVHTARALAIRGGAMARFNFRGVGDSAGAYDDGLGETDDFRSVLRWVGDRFPDVPHWVGGFSFGSIRAMHCADPDTVTAYLGIAPPVTLSRNASAPVVDVPAALVLAGDDELVPRPTDADLERCFPQLRRLEVVPSSGHLFRGFLDELRDAVEVCAAELLA